MLLNNYELKENSKLKHFVSTRKNYSEIDIYLEHLVLLAAESSLETIFIDR
jgi:hypothetical protein